MEYESILRRTVAEIFQKLPEEIGPDFILSDKRLRGSVGRGILDAAIRRRLGKTVREVYSVRTYGELTAVVLDNAAAGGTASAPAAQAEPGSAGPKSAPSLIAPIAGLACGVDIEMVENLPAASDYWTHEFYACHFSKAEIAYCVSREEPRMHFAVRWCAKEALKKCDPAYESIAMSAVEVAVDGHGRPSLRLSEGDGHATLPHAVSLTHTPQFAAAIVVGLARAAPPDFPAAATGQETQESAPAAPPGPSIRSRFLAWFIR